MTMRGWSNRFDRTILGVSSVVSEWYRCAHGDMITILQRAGPATDMDSSRRDGNDARVNEKSLWCSPTAHGILTL